MAIASNMCNGNETIIILFSPNFINFYKQNCGKIFFIFIFIFFLGNLKYMRKIASNKIILFFENNNR